MQTGQSKSNEYPRYLRSISIPVYTTIPGTGSITGTCCCSVPVQSQSRVVAPLYHPVCYHYLLLLYYCRYRYFESWYCTTRYCTVYQYQNLYSSNASVCCSCSCCSRSGVDIKLSPANHHLFSSFFRITSCGVDTKLSPANHHLFSSFFQLTVGNGSNAITSL